MMNLFKKVFLFILCVFLSACSTKIQINPKSTFVVLKTPQIKFSDYGFLYRRDKMTILELYNASKPIFELKIMDKICVNGVCYTKQNFNKKFFNYEHYNDFVQDLINKKQIYQGKNAILTSCGFNQELISKNYNIFYEVCGENMNFTDRQSKIKFSITDIGN